MNRPEWALPLAPMTGREVNALARYNAGGWEQTEKSQFYFAVQQIRWNMERREGELDRGAYALPGGGFLWIGDAGDGIESEMYAQIMRIAEGSG